LIAADGTTTQTVSENTLPASALTMTPITLTDETGYPNIFCPYTGSDLYNVAAYFCQPRASGAKNWEAWIKDSRDNELYRIVLMPDSKWWLAQNVKYANTGSIFSGGCTKEECGRCYSGAEASGSWGGSSGYGQGKQGVCPPGWIIPIGTEVRTLVDACGSTDAESAAALRAYNSTCTPINDTYGFASITGTQANKVNTGVSAWRTHDVEAAHCSFGVDQKPGGAECGRLDIRSSGGCSVCGAVRCFRP
jgi:uncharacterized protein (TIGR02145 family)